jgi:hypothetical protein
VRIGGCFVQPRLEGGSRVVIGVVNYWLKVVAV